MFLLYFFLNFYCSTDTRCKLSHIQQSVPVSPHLLMVFDDTVQLCSRVQRNPLQVPFKTLSDPKQEEVIKRAKLASNLQLSKKQILIQRWCAGSTSFQTGLGLFLMTFVFFLDPEENGEQEQLDLAQKRQYIIQTLKVCFHYSRGTLSYLNLGKLVFCYQ